MAVFIELVTEPLEDRFKDYLKSYRGRDDKNRTTSAGRSVVRRPLRGIEIKEDTYATIRVVTACGKDVELVDSSSFQGISRNGYSNFILQSVQDVRMEKHQIIETFGEAYVFFFGEAPRFLDCQALLLNTHDFNWRAEWWLNYDSTFRGTRLAELGARLYLFYDDVIIEGYLLACNGSESADKQNAVAISFKIFVTNYSNVSIVQPPENSYFPVRGSVDLPEDVSLEDPNAGLLLIDPNASHIGGSVGSISDGIRRYSEEQGLPAWSDAAYGTDPATGETTVYSNVVQNLFNRPDVIITDASENPVGQWSNKTNDVIYRTGNPIRNSVAANIDEFTGIFGPGEFSYDQNTESSMHSVIQRKLDVDDLQQRTIYACSCYGADIDDPEILQALGLGPGFGTAKKQASFSAYASAVASSGRNSGGTAAKTSVGNGFGGKQDPLNSVYGRPEGSSEDLGSMYKFEEGHGDPNYGYSSPYAGGPGYGNSGFGDVGGAGTGSGAGASGDPGFKSPALFTGEGVSGAQAAYNKFVSPKHDSTALTKGGPGVSMGTSGGASVIVSGTPSAFALVSVEGTLNSLGQAREAPGFTSSPSFGAQCPLQTGVSYSLP